MHNMKLLLSILALFALASCKNSDKRSLVFDYDGAEIHYRVVGEGSKNMLFIHGWGCDMDAWTYQTEFFKDKAKLILIDLPGFGKSSKDFDDYSINVFADACLRIIDHLKLENVNLVGHSLGHPIAKRMTELKPALIESLCIIDGVYFDFPSDDLDKEAYKNQLQGFVSLFSGEARSKNLVGFVQSLFIENTPEHVKEYTDRTMMQVDQNVGLATMEALIKEDNWLKIPVEKKTLAVYADIPELPATNESILLDWYPNLTYVEMPEVGHFLMMENPSAFNDLLYKFIWEQ